MRLDSQDHGMLRVILLIGAPQNTVHWKPVVCCVEYSPQNQWRPIALLISRSTIPFDSSSWRLRALCQSTGSDLLHDMDRLAEKTA